MTRGIAQEPSEAMIDAVARAISIAAINAMQSTATSEDVVERINEILEDVMFPLFGADPYEAPAAKIAEVIASPTPRDTLAADHTMRLAVVALRDAGHLTLAAELEALKEAQQ